MKTITSKLLLLPVLMAILTGCSSNDDLMVQDTKVPVEKKEVSKTQTYTIRYGLVSQNGTKTLS